MNEMELSPNYAASLRGLTNTFGNISGFIAPLVAGVIITNNVSFCMFFRKKKNEIAAKLLNFFKQIQVDKDAM